MRIYISGPMTGLPDLNLPTFNRVEKVLRDQQHTPINPACLPIGLSYAQYMDIALAMVRAAEAILLLPNWEGSAGARAELAYASSLKHKVITDLNSLGIKL